MPRIRGTGIILCLLLVTAVGPAVARDEKRDPETGKIRVIYLGDCIVQENPSLAFIPEPWIDVTRIPASLYWQWAHEMFLGESVHKLMRQYMPRTYDNLVGDYDVLILSDANVQMFNLLHLDWFKRGVEEGGLGLTMIGGDETYGGMGPHPSWGPTSVGEILPVDCIDGLHPKDKNFIVKVLRPDHSLLTSLPLEQSPIPAFLGLSATITRTGSDELARLTATGPLGGSIVWPFLVEWDRGEGRVFAFTSDWTRASGDLFILWDYYDDFCINLMLHLAGVGIPQDRELLHQVRARVREYQMRKIFLFAMIDFIERFGAQTDEVGAIISDSEAEKAIADRQYMDVDLVGAKASIESALEKLREADVVAAKLKDSALLQVYIIEWLAVTGVSLLAGSILYQLMIGRKMYREISTTKFRGDA